MRYCVIYQSSSPLRGPPYAPFGYSALWNPSGSALEAYAWCAVLGLLCYMFHIHVLLTYQPHLVHMLASIYSSISTHVFSTLNLSSNFVTSCLLVFTAGSSAEPASHLCSYQNQDTAGLGGRSIKAEAKSCTLRLSACPRSCAPRVFPHPLRTSQEAP